MDQLRLELSRLDSLAHLARKSVFTTLNGNLDEVGIWNTALSPAEVSNVFANGIPEPSTGVLGVLGVFALLLRRRRR